MLNSVNLLFAIDRKFTGLLSNCLRSIVRNGGAEHYEVYILHSDLNQTAIDHIIGSVGECVTYHFIKVNEDFFECFPESKRYPKQIYYRLAAPLLLPKDLDRILYLDVDLVVINSLQELYTMDFEGKYYIACSHTKEFLTKLNQVRLGVDDVPYINTGVLLFNLPLLRSNLSMDVIRNAAEKSMHKFILPDQDLLTILHGEHIKLVDTMRFNLSDRLLSMHNADPRNDTLGLQWVRENAVIIHYYGKNKPWKDNYRGILNVFYQENL